MSDEELCELAEDIFLYGQKVPILVFEDKIIDGRNRYLACEKKGVEPKVEEFEGSGSQIVSTVISLNLRRRQLDESQRALAAARLANMRKGAQETNAQICAFVSQTDAAEMLNISRRSVQHATSVIENGVMELVEKVEEGEMSVSAAARALRSCPRASKFECSSGDAKTERRFLLN